MKAYVIRKLPPAPKPTLSKKVPDWLIEKSQEFQERNKGRIKCNQESRVKGRAGSQYERKKKAREATKMMQGLYESGMSVDEIAKKTGYTRHTVEIKLKITTVYKVDRKKACEMLDQGLSRKDVAKFLGCAPATIGIIIREREKENATMRDNEERT